MKLEKEDKMKNKDFEKLPNIEDQRKRLIDELKNAKYKLIVGTIGGSYNLGIASTVVKDCIEQNKFTVQAISVTSQLALFSLLFTIGMISKNECERQLDILDNYENKSYQRRLK